MRKWTTIIWIFAAFGCNDHKVEKTTPVDTNLTSTKTCIKHIIAQDSVLGAVRNHAPETMPLSTAINQYAQDLQGLDYTGCPSGFVMAFHAHIEAWKEVTQVTDDYSELRGELHTVFDSLEKSPDSVRFRKLVKGVWDTWADVEEQMQ
ncbi:MAG: hypothetical protein AAF466_00960 [Bacteroidota bacterium]